LSSPPQGGIALAYARLRAFAGSKGAGSYEIDITERDSATIRAFPEDGEKKLFIQIEDKAGDILAYIKLSPEKASRA